MLVALFLNLVKQLSSSVMFSGMPAFGIVVPALIDAVTGESEALDDVDQKVSALINESYHTGLDYLRIASEKDSRSRIESISRARDAFLRAKNTYYSIDKLNAARAAVYVGSCSDMLGEYQFALSTYEESYKLCSDHEDHAFEKSGKGILRGADIPLSCFSLQHFPMSRRQFIASSVAIVSQSMQNHTEGQTFVDELQKLYPYMDSICGLLRRRGSRIIGIPAYLRATPEIISEREAQFLERHCQAHMLP